MSSIVRPKLDLLIHALWISVSSLGGEILGVYSLVNDYPVFPRQSFFSFHSM
jgi:hypothetical protein